MRVALVVAASLLLSGCAWVHKELGTAPAPAPAVVKPEPPTPAPRPTRKPHARVSVPSPAAQSPQVPQPAALPEAAPPVPPPNYDARCHAMAVNRANDARQLGASASDQSQVEGDTYRDCMAQSVK